MAVTNIELQPGAGHTRQGDELVPKKLNVSLPAEPEGPLPPSSDPNHEGPPSVEMQAVTALLLPRHHDWLLHAAARDGVTPEKALERLVRAACARDQLWMVDTRPQAPGYGAGTGRR